MGTWGSGPFENDEAGDWSFEFDGADEAAGLRILTDALHLAASSGYLDAPEGANAVAAAAVVSWLGDRHAISDQPDAEDAAAWIRTTIEAPSGELVNAALAALDRVRSDESALAELWAEVDDVEWRESLAQIESRLRTLG